MSDFHRPSASLRLSSISAYRLRSSASREAIYPLLRPAVSSCLRRKPRPSSSPLDWPFRPARRHGRSSLRLGWRPPPPTALARLRRTSADRFSDRKVWTHGRFLRRVKKEERKGLRPSQPSSRVPGLPRFACADRVIPLGLTAHTPLKDWLVWIALEQSFFKRRAEVQPKILFQMDCFFCACNSSKSRLFCRRILSMVSSRALIWSSGPDPFSLP